MPEVTPTTHPSVVGVSYCAVHGTHPSAGDPCWQCVQNEADRTLGILDQLWAEKKRIRELEKRLAFFAPECHRRHSGVEPPRLEVGTWADMTSKDSGL